MRRQSGSNASAAPSPASLAADPTIAAGTELGVYRLERKLGEGGMGAVWRATHGLLKKTVAIKILPQELTRDSDALARFRREMEAVGALDHPNIVRAMDAGEAAGTHYLAMEHVEGVDLAKLIATKGPRPVREACEIIRQAAVGLQHAHEHGLVHRDVKPENLILSRQARVKILDLGISRLQGDAAESTTTDPQAAATQAANRLTVAGFILGTPDYIAPEQITETSAADHRADLYALGCTLFFLLTGRAPFDDAAHPSIESKLTGHTSELPPDLAAKRTDVPSELDALYRRLLAKAPAERPQSAADVARELAAIIKGRSGATQRAGGGLEAALATFAADAGVPAPYGAPRSRRTPARPLVIAGLAVAVALAVFAAVAFHRSGEANGPTAAISGPQGAGHEPARDDEASPAAESPRDADARPAARGGDAFAGKNAGDEWIANGLRMTFCWCPNGTFTMGGPAVETGQTGDNRVLVTLTGFWLGEYEVTQWEWTRVMTSTIDEQRRLAAGSKLFGNGPKHPMYYVNYDEAAEFCRELTQRERADGRLPDGWEYACPRKHSGNTVAGLER